MGKADAGPMIIARLIAVLMLLLGLILVAGGGYLLLLGGSPYYALSGFALMAVAWLLWRRDRRGAWLYGAYLGSTAIWAVWEAGLDFWALLPRMLGPCVLGLLLLLPPIQRALIQPRSAIARGAVLAGVLLAVGLGLYLATEKDDSSARTVASAGGNDPTALGRFADDWPAYGRSPGGTRYSPLAQINPGNVSQLKKAWTFHTGKVATSPIGILEVTPIKIADTLYLCNSENRLFAVDAETGRMRWSYDPKPDLRGLLATHCRGVAYFRDPAAQADQACAERIVSATVDARLIAVDAMDGRPCRGFGSSGSVDLTVGMGPHTKGYYDQSSAPTIVKGKIIVGGAVLDNQTTGEPSGVVRAFDAVSGKFAWAWDLQRPERRGEPPAGEFYTAGTPNVWAPMSADEKLGLVYLPTGNATPDFWGGERTAAMNKFASSVVALDVVTGALRWSYQTTHHDVWDYDVPAQPTLVDVPVGGKIVPALIQPTKRGQTFVLDRRTGHPLTPVVERPVPRGFPDVERLSPTQPYPVAMPSMGGAPLTEASMWGTTPIDQLYCRIKFRQARYQGDFTPPGLTNYIQYPGYAGGSSWGSVAVDPERNVMIVNVTHFAQYGRLMRRAEADAAGMKPFAGGAMMGGGGEVGITRPQIGTPFGITLEPFLSPLGVPCQQPPFGMIAAIDLNSMKVLWKKPLGTAFNSGPLGIEMKLSVTLGTPNQGGALVTRTGLVFIGATQERVIRAYDVATGKILWKAPLPAGGNATPMTYRTRNGRQMVVIAAGGNVLLGGPSGDALVAYALP